MEKIEKLMEKLDMPKELLDTEGNMKIEKIDTIDIFLGYELIMYANNKKSNLLSSIAKLRKELLDSESLLLPVIRIRDDYKLGDSSFAIYINDTQVLYHSLDDGQEPSKLILKQLLQEVYPYLESVTPSEMPTYFKFYEHKKSFNKTLNDFKEILGNIKNLPPHLQLKKSKKHIAPEAILNDNIFQNSVESLMLHADNLLEDATYLLNDYTTMISELTAHEKRDSHYRAIVRKKIEEGIILANLVIKLCKTPIYSNNIINTSFIKRISKLSSHLLSITFEDEMANKMFALKIRINRALQ